MWPPKKEIKAKQFRLPLEEGALNRVYNNPNVEILDEKIFQDKPGDVVVFLKYEITITEEEDELFE